MTISIRNKNELMIIGAIFFIPWIFIAVAKQTPEIWGFFRDTSANTKGRILLIGDSVCNGYKGFVRNELHGEYSVDSYVTDKSIADTKILSDIVRILGTEEYVVIHFNFGLHDIKSVFADSMYDPLISGIFSILKENAKGAVLIWATTTPVVKADNQKEIDQEINRYIVTRNSLSRTSAMEFGVAVDDLYEVTFGREDLRALDALHFTKDGYQEIAKSVTGAIRSTILKH